MYIHTHTHVHSSVQKDGSMSFFTSGFFHESTLMDSCVLYLV